MHQTKAASDFTSVEQQKAVSALFTERCQLGMTRTQAAAAAAAAVLGGGEGSEGTSGESLEGHDAAAELGAMRRAETTKKKQNEGVSYVDGSRAYVSPDGERLRANTVVEAFGGLKAFLRLKALGEQKARL
jgi:hypothetical protein